MGRKLFLTCLLHGSLGYAASYHISVLNPLEEVIKAFISNSLLRYTQTEDTIKAATTWLWGLLNGTMTLSFLISSLFLTPLVEKLGRKTCCCLLQPAFLMAGSLCMLLAKYTNMFELLILGHTFCGMAYTFISFGLVYIAECAPVKFRAPASNLMYMGSPFWLCIGSTAALPHVLGSQDLWQYAVALPMLPAFLYIVIAFIFVPESPKFLRITKGDKIGAREGILFYHGPDVDVGAVEAEMDREAALDASITSLGLKEVFRKRHHRWPFIIVLVAGISMQAGASGIVRSYSTQLLNDEFGYSEENAALTTEFVISWPTIIACGIGMFLAYKAPRRIHFLGAILMADCGMFLQFISLIPPQGKRNSLVGLVGMCLSIWAYFGGLGSVGSYLAAELCSQHTRALASTGRFIARGILETSQLQAFPPLNAALGAWALPICCFSDIFCFIFLVFFLPETKGKTVDQVVERWTEKEEEIPLKEYFDSKSDIYLH